MSALLGFAQEKNTPSWKAQYQHDVRISGVGLTASRPNIGELHTLPSPWVTADVQFLFINARFGQGSYDWNPEAAGRTFMTADDPWTRVNVSHAAIGINAPLPFLAFGNYESFDRVFRINTFVRANWGVQRFFVASQGEAIRYGNFEFAPGVRLRVPYASLDLALSFNWLGLDARDPDHMNLRGIDQRWVFPTMTLRFDGLFDGMSVGSRTTQGGAFSSSRSEKRQRYTDASGRRMERQTVTYNSSVTSQAVSLTDIGSYRGIGLKVTRSAVRSRDYQNAGTLVGATALFRGGTMSLGLNAEAGRVGHVSALQEWKDGYRRQADRRESGGMGNISTLNLYADLGISLNNLIYAMMGTIVLDDESTPFSTINMGISLGVHAVLGQEFNDPEASTPLYDAVPPEDRSWFNDPRESKGGLMGGYFFSWDVGNASFKAQWLRYRRAPMANGLMYSVAWRFGSSQ